MLWYSYRVVQLIVACCRRIPVGISLAIKGWVVHPAVEGGWPAGLLAMWLSMRVEGTVIPFDA
jgi:hypothetical protein